jgi:hypothetical protein
MNPMFLLSRPRLTVFIGFIMMVLGIVFPLLMVMKVLESTFFLNFLSYTLSLVGMILGVIGIAFEFKMKK